MFYILDELDALFKKRDGNINTSGEDTKVVNTFLSEMSGMKNIDDVIFVGTTNRIESLDDAVIRSGRMEAKIKVDLPDKKGIKQIYIIHLNKLPGVGQKLFDEIDIEHLSQKMIDMSGADIEFLINKLITKKVLESKGIEEVQKITQEEFEMMISKIKGQAKSRSIGFHDK